MSYDHTEKFSHVSNIIPFLSGLLNLYNLIF